MVGERYPVILTDPPWKYYGAKDKWAAAGKHYECLEYGDIRDIVPPLDSPGVLFMWTTSAFMEQSINLLKDWGLHYRGISFVWVKTKADGTPIGAQGVRPSITKPLTEFVIAGSTAMRGRPMKLGSEAIQQTVFAARREHSRKPDEVYERIVQLYPDVRRLDMFSRQTREGWDSWGNEVGRFDD